MDVLRQTLRASDQPRSQFQAVRTFRDLNEQNLAIDEFNDKRARLDAGRPTEITSDRLALETRASDLLDSVVSVLRSIAPRDRVVVEAVVRDPADVRRLEDRATAGGVEPQAD